MTRRVTAEELADLALPARIARVVDAHAPAKGDRAAGFVVIAVVTAIVCLLLFAAGIMMLLVFGGGE